MIILDMVEFNVSLGMNYLSPYDVILDFYVKTITLAMLGGPRIEWKGLCGFYLVKVISFIKVHKLIDDVTYLIWLLFKIKVLIRLR